MQISLSLSFPLIYEYYNRKELSYKELKDYIILFKLHQTPSTYINNTSLELLYPEAPSKTANKAFTKKMQYNT